jgi:hypothetical protein
MGGDEPPPSSRLRSRSWCRHLSRGRRHCRLARAAGDDRRHGRNRHRHRGGRSLLSARAWPALRRDVSGVDVFLDLLCRALQVQLDRSHAYGNAAVRGVVAAILSGLAFYAISGIWTRPSPEGPNYVRNFLSWTFAFFPGFAALFMVRLPKVPQRISPV